MKKINLLLTAVLALGFVSCDDYEEPNPAPQTNPQEPVMAVDGTINIVTTAEAAAGIDISTYTTNSTPVPVVKIGQFENFPEGYSLQLVMQLGSDVNFTKTENLDVTITPDSIGTVDVAALQAAHLKVFGKNPKQQDAYGRFAAYAVKDAAKARIGGLDVYYGNVTFKETPLPASVYIEPAYYLVSSTGDLVVSNAKKFDHTGDEYDNPNFTLKLDVSAADAATGLKWKVIPESTFKTGDWVAAQDAAFGAEFDGDEMMEGILNPRTADTDCGAYVITEAGQYLLSINMETKIFSITSAVDNLWTPGDANGWNHGASQQLYTNNYSEYFGYASLSGTFKFTTAPDWSHTAYGDGGGDGKLSTDGGAGNLSVAAAGLYWCEVNTAALTYKTTAITTIGLIGDFNSWGSSLALTPSADFLTWTGDVTLDGGTFKFRANDGWDINLGGSLDNLTQGGDNLSSPGAGEYTVTLNLGSLPYTATLVKK